MKYKVADFIYHKIPLELDRCRTVELMHKRYGIFAFYYIIGNDGRVSYPGNYTIEHKENVDNVKIL